MPPRRYAAMVQGDLPLPHYLEIEPPSAPSVFEALQLRQGEVLEIVYPDDSRSISQRFVEYRVAVQHLDPQSRTGTTREYRCTIASMFGGLPDREIYTLRPAESQDEQGYGNGSKVLVLCVDGSEVQALIIGGVRDQEDQRDSGAKDLGHFYSWGFNGVKFDVASDGGFVLQRTGPMKADNKRADGVAADSTCALVLHPDGSTTLGALDDNSSTSGEFPQRVKIDQKKKLVEIRAKNGVSVGGDDQKMPLFETYRDGESQMHHELQAALNTAVGQVTTISAIFQTVALLLVAPIVGPVLAAPQLVQASTQLTLLAQTFARMAASLGTFESDAESFLSPKNTNN